MGQFGKALGSLVALAAAGPLVRPDWKLAEGVEGFEPRLAERYGLRTGPVAVVRGWSKPGLAEGVGNGLRTISLAVAPSCPDSSLFAVV